MQCGFRLVARGENKRESDTFRTCFENEQECSFRRCHSEQGSVTTAVEESHKIGLMDDKSKPRTKRLYRKYSHLFLGF